MNVKFIIALLIFFSACSSHENKQLEYVLRHAGENRIALEKVLKHYQNEPEKLSAANFLIQNMVGKQTIDSNSITESQLYFDAFTAYFKKYGAYKNNVQYFICDSIKQL